MNDTAKNTIQLDQWLITSAWPKHARLGVSPVEKARLTKMKTWDEIKLLLEAHPEDQIEILAQTMPLRNAVWWGMLCGAAVEGFAACELTADCILAVIDWIFQTDEPHRLRARAAAETIDWKIPEGLLAKAVAWSAGSILPEAVPAFLPAPEGVTGQMIAGAVRSFAARNKNYRYDEFVRYCISLGEEVACGFLLPAGWHLQNMKLNESSMISLDLSPVEIPGHLGFGF